MKVWGYFFRVANSADPDKLPYFVPSELNPHCLNVYLLYGFQSIMSF